MASAHLRQLLRASGLLVALSACGSRDATSSADSVSVAPPGAAPSASAAPAASAASSAKRSPWGPLPTAARRNTPPPGIDAKAIVEGAAAPPFTLPVPVTGATWSLAQGLAKWDYVVLVFYRGAW